MAERLSWPGKHPNSEAVLLNYFSRPPLPSTPLRVPDATSTSPNQPLQTDATLRFALGGAAE